MNGRNQGHEEEEEDPPRPPRLFLSPPSLFALSDVQRDILDETTLLRENDNVSGLLTEHERTMEFISGVQRRRASGSLVRGRSHDAPTEVNGVILPCDIGTNIAINRKSHVPGTLSQNSQVR